MMTEGKDEERGAKKSTAKGRIGKTEAEETGGQGIEETGTGTKVRALA